MHADILIYAAIAALVFARLWTVLGRKNDGEAERPNPFAAPPAPPLPVSDVPVLPPVISVPPASLEGGLAQVKTLDPAFDERAFLRQAREDFTAIVADFAAGDMTRSAGRLSPRVLQSFNAAIAARKQAGQVLENKITRITDVETAAVKIEGSVVSIAVRIVSDQQNVLRDASGRAVGGAEGKVEEITDLWSFGRDTAVAESPWLLVETKS